MTFSKVLSVAAAAVLCSPWAVAEEVDAALAADDHCAPGDGACAVNALQFMARRTAAGNVPSWCQFVPSAEQQVACRGTNAGGCSCKSMCKDIPAGSHQYNPECCSCGQQGGQQKQPSFIANMEVPPLALAVPGWCQYVPSSYQQVACRGSSAQGCRCAPDCEKEDKGSWMMNPECCACGGSQNQQQKPKLLEEAVLDPLPSACSCDSTCRAKPGNLWQYDMECCGCGAGATTLDAAQMVSAVGNVVLLHEARGEPAWCHYVPAEYQQAACRGSNPHGSGGGCSCDDKTCKQIPSNQWQWNPDCCGCGGGGAAAQGGQKPSLSEQAGDLALEPQAHQKPMWCQYVPTIVGSVPGTPCPAGLPSAPGVPGGPGGNAAATATGAGSVPGMPRMPGMPGAGSVPAVPGMPIMQGGVALDQKAGNTCMTGLVGKVHSHAPDCLDACPQACAPLGTAITAYLTKGGQPAARSVVCAHKAEFSCAVTPANYPKCKKLFTKAASFGFKLPSSQQELTSECN